MRRKLAEVWNDPVWSKVIAGAILATGGLLAAYLLRTIVPRAWDFARGVFSAAWALRWQILVSVIALVFAFYRGRAVGMKRGIAEGDRQASERARSEKEKNAPIIAVDKRCCVQWRISGLPRGWEEKSPDSIDTYVLGTAIRGPFHLKEGCLSRARACRIGDSHPDAEFFACDQCHIAEKPNIYPSTSDSAKMTLISVLMELQRLHRQGQLEGKEVELMQPLYWNWVSKFPE